MDRVLIDETAVIQLDIGRTSLSLDVTIAVKRIKGSVVDSFESERRSIGSRSSRQSLPLHFDLVRHMANVGDGIRVAAVDVGEELLFFGFYLGDEIFGLRKGGFLRLTLVRGDAGCGDAGADGDGDDDFDQVPTG